MPHNPNRNYAIHWLNDQRALAVAAIAAAGGGGAGGGGGGTDPPADATGELFGDVRGALLGPLSVVGIHGDEITPPALTGDADDYAPEDPLPLIWRLGFAGFAITGIAAPTALGEVHLIAASSAGTLAHEDAGSAAANRILCPDGADLELPANGAVIVAYVGTSQRWQVVGVGGAVTFGTPALTLGTANAAGSTDEVIRRDATILVFDATVPAAIGAAAAGAATVTARRDHVHPTGAGTPSTQAFGDAAATGSGPAAAMTDHKHAMPANPGLTAATFTVANGGTDHAYDADSLTLNELADIVFTLIDDLGGT